VLPPALPGDAAAPPLSPPEELDDLIPQLYRCLALYLQVLRQGLLPAVEQACFHVATQVYPGRYARLSPRRRRHLHHRISGLVRRCSSLLTVEQLATLAARLHAEHDFRRHEEGRDLLERLGADAAGDALGRPDGSIHLDLNPPIALAPAWSVLMPPGPEGAFARSHDDDDDHDPGDDSGHGGELPFAAESGPGEDLAALSSRLLEAFAAALSAGLAPEVDSLDPPPEPSPWQDGRLPRHPVLLLQWLDGFEQALVRRLRNLSHAINVELTNAGLCVSLLPIGVLDAVIDGQIESQGGPPNLLRLEVPLSIEIATGQLQMTAVLFRCTDLEMEQPKLRTCRHRLLQKRQELRRMADQFRRLQRRQEISEAERLWLQDLRAGRRHGPITGT
jgi:hypothetical protein